jgi:hypothetical protein
MLVKPKDIAIAATIDDTRFGVHTSKRMVRSEADIRKNLDATIGFLNAGEDIHFYSFGHFNLVRLMLKVVEQIGPCNVLMTSYSFSKRSIEQLTTCIAKGEIISLKLLIDYRVKVMSPKPFEMIKRMFDYRCSSIHAKVALLWNDEWQISIVTSQNATDNPKMERGTIFTSKEVFDFDFKIISDEFERGTT